MEAYSPAMQCALEADLAQQPATNLALLWAYYQLRRGPGLALVRAEYLRRGWPDPLPPSVMPIGANTFPPACPVCLQQRNRCICPPFLTN